MESQLHPLDFQSLTKGQLINESDTATIFGYRFEKDPRRYQIELMKLRQQIWDACPGLVAVIKGLGLRILTDREAEQYLWDEQRKLVEKQKRIAKARGRIDRSEFSDFEQRVAEHRDAYAAGTAIMLEQSIRKAENAQLGMAEEPKELTP